MEAVSQTLAQALSHHQAQLVKALTPLESATDREWFAHVVLGRLLLLYDLQVAGFLAEGDRWYLHNQLGQYAQSQSGTFFKGFLQPLCHQGLGLPVQERPPQVQQAIGNVPYLGSSLFHPHPLEQAHPELDIADEPIEQLLGWLAEQPWQRTEEPRDEPIGITRRTLAEAYEYLITDRTGKATITSLEMLSEICRKTIDAHLLHALKTHGYQTDSVDSWLAAMPDPVCELLIDVVLPSLTVLDPACGSGRFLLMASLRLQAVYRACWQGAQRSTSPRLQRWVRSLQTGSAPPQQVFVQNILTQNLYGVDLLPEAITITQLQLWLQFLATVETAAALAPLPNLDFNITSGNALVGFIRVDQESFDKVLPKRLKPHPPTETVLQGNLLQPLAAANYRDTLAEKKIRVEHYQVQTQAMGAEGGVPEYAQTEFLRDRIVEVNQVAGHKLDTFLFETFGQKLGIQVQEPQNSGRTRKRLLTLDDVKALRPFHWGFFFNAIIEQQGGFDVIVTHAPSGNLSPSTDEFYRQQAALFQLYGVDQATFRRSRRQTLLASPPLAKAWGLYAGHINCIRDYVRRSEDYPLPAANTARRSIPLKALFVCRCLALTKTTGVAPYIHE